jgi:hypothetical protein
MLMLHPGDLGASGWLMLLAMFLLVCVLPLVIVGFIIYKIFNKKESE